MIGTSSPRSAQTLRIAQSAAFTFRTSNAVSTRRMSTPPSRRARACSRNASSSASKSTARKPGSSTLGDMEAVWLVGPIDPATNRRREGSFAIASSTACRASFAAARLSSATRPSCP